jgi:hypothetical protein
LTWRFVFPLFFGEDELPQSASKLAASSLEREPLSVPQLVCDLLLAPYRHREATKRLPPEGAGFVSGWNICERRLREFPPADNKM